MANDAYFTMAIAGYKDNVNALINIINETNPDKLHMYRIFESNEYDRIDIGLWSKAYLYGFCAWSVSCCMMPGISTYFTSHFNDAFKHLIDHKQVQFFGTNLILEAKRLNLAIEVYSTEPGMSFCESIKILPDGIVARDVVGKYESWWIDDFDSYKDMIDIYCDGNEVYCPFTEDVFNTYKDNGLQEWVDTEYVFEDTIPDYPKRLVKSRLYHLNKPNEEYVPLNRRLDSPLKLRLRQISLFPDYITEYYKMNNYIL